jgi:quinol monooxygenase YgiN
MRQRAPAVTAAIAVAAAVCLAVSLALSTGASAQSPVTADAKAAATTFVVKFHAKPGKNAELEKAFREMQDGVRKNEPGNVYYDFFVDSQDPQMYVIIERYKDAAGTAAHGKSEHAKKLIAALKDLTDKPPEAMRLVLISAKD